MSQSWPAARRAFAFSGKMGANLRVKALSEIGTKAGRLLLVLVAARVWGPERFGIYAVAGAFAAIATTAADFGLQLHLARSVAQGGGRAALGAAIRAKLLLTLGSLVILGAASALYPRPELRVTLLVASLVLLLQSWCDFWNHYFRGRHSLRDEAILSTSYILGGSLVACAAVARGAGVTTIYLILLAAALLGNLVGWLRMRRMLDGGDAAAPEPSASADAGAAGIEGRKWSASYALKDAFPIGLAILLSTIFFRMDMVLLERLRGDAETGAYGAAYRLLESFLFLPALLLSALFPAFAGAARARRADLAHLLDLGLRWMFGAGFLLAAGIALASPWALRLLYGDSYRESIVLLQLLAPVLLFVFPNYVLTHFLVAVGRQAQNTWIMALGVPMNLALNLAVIPTHGARGAALATLGTEVALFLAAWIAARRRLAQQPADGAASDQ